MNLKKIFLIVVISLTAFSCKKDDDGLVHFPFGSFKEVKEATLPDWLVGKWQDVELPEIFVEFNKNTTEKENFYISISEDRVVIVLLDFFPASTKEDPLLPKSDFIFYQEAIKVDSKTIKYKRGTMKKNDKSCSCVFYTYKKVQ
ncbi:hypothetical protein [Capnocytophaga canis]|uniref:hypothetical protein n=1 Tax=Capnocytophaga canis TaxID=1848903 RepID=UPI0015623D8A|nr:hypothetical protein [Capnocytophaga canis]GIM60393.1 hypothetical protein CAPN008_04430 [Capnocytophaga canis]